MPMIQPSEVSRVVMLKAPDILTPTNKFTPDSQHFFRMFYNRRRAAIQRRAVLFFAVSLSYALFKTF